MTIIANDFVPIKPYDTNVVTLGIGQRSDVLVKAHLPPGSAVFMRSDISTNCSLTNQPHALAAIYYDDANTTLKPNSTATPYNDTHCGNDPLSSTVPFFPFPATSNPATTQTIDITFGANATGHFVWFMNGESFRANYE